MVTRLDLPWSRALLGLISASVVSDLGSLMSAVALPWFVLQTTGSASRMGFVLAAESAPLWLLGGLSARAVRRLGARTALLVTDAMWVVFATAIPALHYAGALTYPALVALAFLGGVPWAAHAGSETATLPALTGRDARRVAQATALLHALTRMSYLAGPVLGGVLVAAIGAPAVLLADAASFGLSLLLILVSVPRIPGGEDDAEAPIAGGWRLIRGHPWLRSVTTAQALSQGAYMGMTAAIPALAFARYRENAHLAGALLGVWGGGAMIGALAAVGLMRRADPHRLASAAWALQATPLWALVTGPPAVVAAGALAVSGLANGVRNPPVFGLTAEYVPAAVLAETMTAAGSLVLGGGFVALLVAGLALDRVGLAVVWAGIAATQSCAALVFARARPRRRPAS